MDATTAPQEIERKPRAKKRGGLYVTDAELIEKLQVPEKVSREALAMLDKDPKSGFPKKQRLWGDRRYWPAVRAYFDATNGLKIAPPSHNGRER
jgi:hypothetical protein